MRKKKGIKFCNKKIINLRHRENDKQIRETKPKVSKTDELKSASVRSSLNLHFKRNIILKMGLESKHFFKDRSQAGS